MSNITDLLNIRSKVTAQGTLEVDRDTVADGLKHIGQLNPSSSAILASVVELVQLLNKKIIVGSSEPPDPTTYDEGTIYFQI